MDDVIFFNFEKMYYILDQLITFSKLKLNAYNLGTLYILWIFLLPTNNSFLKLFQLYYIINNYIVTII